MGLSVIRGVCNWSFRRGWVCNGRGMRFTNDGGRVRLMSGWVRRVCDKIGGGWAGFRMQ